MFSTCHQIEFSSCMSALHVSQDHLYIGPDIIFGIFCDMYLPLLPPFIWPFSTRAKKAWHSPEGPSQSWAAGIWWRSPQFCSVLAAPFLLPPPLLILAFYSQPASEYNTEEPCAVNTDTHPWAYTHIHTFISHWKRQDQRRKEEQTPLRCWAWLHVPLDTDGCTQDNCCLLFMEGPSATLHALFIWRLPKGHSQEPQGKEKWISLCLLYACKCAPPRTCARSKNKVHVFCVCVSSGYVRLLYNLGYHYSSVASTLSVLCLLSWSWFSEEASQKPSVSTGVSVTIELFQQVRVYFLPTNESRSSLLFQIHSLS